MSNRLQKSQLTTTSTTTQVAFGDLTLVFVDQFSLRWNDGGSGGDHDGAFWHPNAPSGFRPLGCIGVNNYDDPAGRQWALCVKATVEGSDAVRSPTGYNRIWTDQGSGADRDGACWEAIPPAGYAGLGHVFTSDYNPPSLEDIWCVRSDLVGEALLGDWLWDDSGTGSDADFSAWRIDPTTYYHDNTTILIGANCFYGVASHDRPSPVVKVLRLEPPTEQGDTPPVPRLDSYDRPPAESDWMRERRITVPFTGVTDDHYDLAWKIANSPFYFLERWDNFQLELYDNNQQAEPHELEREITVGVTKSSTETFNHEVGISISYETGVSFGGVGSKVKGTLSYKFGYSTSTSVTNFQQNTVKLKLKTPGKHAAAMWAPHTMFKMLRADGSMVGTPLFLEDSGVAFYEREYPDTPSAKPRRRIPR
ncbi:Vps62-related protein [Bosea sp. Tri-44]|uniref:Vps62-related protein n=1 Tax=Bosea sp. Tri-44 TaxID=1972137 RepID=UPI0013E993E4|nr:Vps62-related protein [Bosea sp. Tri-44]